MPYRESCDCKKIEIRNYQPAPARIMAGLFKYSEKMSLKNVLGGWFSHTK